LRDTETFGGMTEMEVMAAAGGTPPRKNKRKKRPSTTALYTNRPAARSGGKIGVVKLTTLAI
jgi:hypothetical protein